MASTQTEMGSHVISTAARCGSIPKGVRRRVSDRLNERGWVKIKNPN